MPKKTKLPDKILCLPNADKGFHEKWEKGRNLLNIHHPFRAILAARPNCGKTTIVKNLIVRADPPYEEIKVIHGDAEYTKEYEDLGDEVEMLSEIPLPDAFQGEVKTLVIIDDLELKTLSKIQQKALDRLFGYVSTHKNISVCLCSQDGFNIPPIVRRCSNLFILWKGNDLDSMARLARKAGLKKDELIDLFKEFCNSYHDSIWIDMTPNSPAPFRLNGYQILDVKTNNI